MDMQGHHPLSSHVERRTMRLCVLKLGVSQGVILQRTENIDTLAVWSAL